jgi:YbbR domain-containing protein
VTGASYSFQTSVKPKALDSDGREIDSDKLAFSQNEIEVNINMIKKKVIDLKIMTVGAPMKGYAVNGDIEYEPKQIVVAGDDSALQKLNNQLVIKENISGASESIEKEIDLQTLLPEGIILVDDNKAVAINIVIEKLISKDLTIWPMDIEQRTLDPTLRAIYSSPGSMTVKILGTQEAIDTLSITTPKPYINFSYLGVGTYSLRIEFDLPEGCILENTPIIGVQLTKK